MNLADAIENLYKVFNQYTTADMHYCECGCKDPKDVAKLASKQLRDLEEDDFASYHGSALYTWGDLQHYKHFLPRIMEVYTQNRSGALIGLWEIGRKMDYAKWREWPINEVKAIEDFLLSDWNEFVNEQINELGDMELEGYSYFFDYDVLLEKWNITTSPQALRNFVVFFFYNGYKIWERKFTVGPLDISQKFVSLIDELDLLERLEDEFFTYEASEPEYAEKISAVLQMIEVQRKIAAD